MSAGPVACPGIPRITPYVQGQQTIEGREPVIKLSSNESSFGPSPEAVAAFHASADALNRYPDGAQTALREAIGEVHGLDPQRIVCGSGSDELIQLVTRAFVRAGDEVLLSEQGFVMSEIHAHAQGATVVKAPEQQDRVDVDALTARIGPATRLVCIANPNNPTGTFLDRSEIRRLHAAIPQDVILLLDGAYAEYVTDPNYDDGAALVAGAGNVVMTRTFSKIYGLSALRIGWAYCPGRVIDAIQRIRSPFNASGPAMAAATAAVRDQAWIAGVREHNAVWLLRIADALRGMGLEVVPSVTNFYLIRFPEHGSANAAGAAAFLLSNGIIPRPVPGQYAGRELRITVGTEAENSAVIKALERYMSGASA